MEKSTRLIGHFVLVSVFALASACTKSGDSGSSTPQEKTGAPEARSEATAQEQPKSAGAPGCSSGKPPKVLKGDCTGQWVFNPAVGKGPASCNFVWGPEVRCPAGTKPLGSPAVCYGTTGKTLEQNEKLTPAECAKKFGHTPQPPHYELSCCEE